jgi:hypothetical protein
VLYHTKSHKQLENETGIKVVLKPTEEEMDDGDEQDI